MFAQELNFELFKLFFLAVVHCIISACNSLLCLFFTQVLLLFFSQPISFPYFSSSLKSMGVKLPAD